MHDELKYWYLRNHKLFNDLNLEEIQQLCIISGFKKGNKGEILNLSTNASRIFLLKKGAIKIVSIQENGREIVKDIIYHGDMFGELSLEHCKEMNEFAKVLTDEVSICSFLLSDFEKLLLRKPTLALTYTKFVGLKMKSMKSYYADMVSKNARTRLVQFLCEWARKDGKRAGSRINIENYLTQTDIAQIICTSRQTATILLNDLEQEGLINYNRKEIIIGDIAILANSVSQNSVF